MQDAYFTRGEARHRSAEPDRHRRPQRDHRRPAAHPGRHRPPRRARLPRRGARPGHARRHRRRVRHQRRRRLRLPGRPGRPRADPGGRRAAATAPPLRASETIIRNIRVLAVDQRLNARDEAGQPGRPDRRHGHLRGDARRSPRRSRSRRPSASSRCRCGRSPTTMPSWSARSRPARSQVPENGDPRAERQMLLADRQPADRHQPDLHGRRRRLPLPAQHRARRGRESNSNGRWQRRARSARHSVASRPIGPIVRIARGNNVTVVPVGARKMTQDQQDQAGRRSAPRSRPRWPRASAATAPSPAVAQSGRALAPANDITLSVGTGRMVRLERRDRRCVRRQRGRRRRPGQLAEPDLHLRQGRRQHHRLRDRPRRPGRLFGQRPGRPESRLGRRRCSSSPCPRRDITRDADERHGPADRHGRRSPPTRRRPSASSRPSSATATQVVSRLRTATPQQVMLQVRIAEVSRSLAREIGTNLLIRDNTRRLPVRHRPRQCRHVQRRQRAARSGHRRHAGRR